MPYGASGFTKNGARCRPPLSLAFSRIRKEIISFRICYCINIEKEKTRCFSSIVTDLRSAIRKIIVKD